MNTNRATRAIWERLRLSYKGRTRLFCAESEAAPPPPPRAPPPPLSSKPNERLFQNVMMSAEREIRRMKGLDPNEVEVPDDICFKPIRELLELQKSKSGDMGPYPEPTDSDSDDDEFIDRASLQKKDDIVKKKLTHHQQLLNNFARSDNLDEAFSWMKRVDKFEEKHFNLRPEYRVIGELMNRLKVAQGKEKFLLQMKLNRAMRMMEWKEAFDPNDPANYGVIQQEQTVPSAELEENAGFEKQKQLIQGAEDDSMEFNDMKEKDDILLEKLTAIDKILEEKLAALDHTFGRKGKLLEEEIRDLAEERNSLTEQKRQPLYRKVSQCMLHS
ncbi:ribosomal protein [Lithospermum erythrorhizon]|uniref:Ribosomal protein n=1 Tax=Lithospermum erythrorhizon TaxID=34254 RepID=A0AAV3R1F4_LITER